MPFRDRIDAGRRLGEALDQWRGEHPVILGLPRGGVPVAAEVAAVLDAPLDVILVRKLGVPAQPELAMGAIGEDGVRVVNDDVMRVALIEPATVSAVERAERVELDARAERFRGDRERIDIGVGRSSSSTTASQPVRLLVPPSRWPGLTARPAWCWPSRSRRRGRAPISVASPTRSSAWRYPIRSWRSASSTEISRRRPMPRSSRA